MKVNFSCEPHLLGAIPNPVPAAKAMPDYFRAIKPQINSHPMSGTVKRCVPFIDAFSSGFIIPLWCDVYIMASNGELRIDFPERFAASETLGTHSQMQIPGHPLSKKPYGEMALKFINPWVIETELGVSCIFTSPFNHMETRFKILDGVVDTDTYYNQVNFPFLWTGGDGEFIIPKGTPLVQVIPFKRQTFELEVSSFDSDRHNKTFAILGTRIKNGYREEFWHKKRSTEPENLKSSDIDHPALELSENNQEKNAAPDIYVDPEEGKAKDTPSVLHSDGYVLLRNLISKDQAKNIADSIRNFLDSNKPKIDSLCPDSKSVRAHPDADRLLEELTDVISEASGKKLVPTYSYARIYTTGNILPKHTDRPSCEYSISLCLDMDGEPWPIYMAETADSDTGTPYERDGVTYYMKNPQPVDLQIGDAVLYLGNEMVHYREPFEGTEQVQVFMHWVDVDGPHAHCAYDGRLALSHKGIAVVEDLKPSSDSESAIKKSSPSGLLEVVASDNGRGFGEGEF